MAKLIPDVERAKEMKQPPTAGEIFLLQYLETHFGDQVEVYFQPCFNGDRPDIVILDKILGVIIIEVKDWNLKCYEVDDRNRWILRANGSRLRSPFHQVHQYKKNFFDIHVNGLLEKSLRNTNFFSLIKTYVYFHGSSKQDLESLYERHFQNIFSDLRKNESDLKAKLVDYDSYEIKRIDLEKMKSRFERDRSTIALTKDKLNKISFPLNKKICCLRSLSTLNFSVS